MTYPGGKGCSGVYQRIINQIPPHKVYIETHLGGVAIMRHKRLAESNIGIDRDSAVISSWKEINKPIKLFQQDALEFLESYNYTGDEFVYLDPPYLRNTRKSKRDIYRYEYSERDHIKLLSKIIDLPCYVMISGYWSDLYANILKDWRTLSFKARDKSGNSVTEWIWMNYAPPNQLHDYHYLGQDYREREKIRRKLGRWQKKISQLPVLERQALLSDLFNKGNYKENSFELHRR